MSNIISQTDQLTVYTQPKPFKLIKPRPTPARGIGVIVDPSCWDEAINYAIECGPMAIDFETQGVDPTLPGSRFIGMGIAGPDCNYYFHRDADPEAFDRMLTRLVSSRAPLLAHNIYFDGLWLYHHTGMHANWICCTLAAYRQIATEGWLGQRWGLKEAMVDVLNWEEANDQGISDWLITNGWHNSQGRAAKGEMWRCPADILGHYCLLDAEATWLLYSQHLLPILERFPELHKFHTEAHMDLLLMLVVQKHMGMTVDVPKLQQLVNSLAISRDETERLIRTNEIAAPLIAEWEQLAIDEFNATEPERYKKKKISKEPKQRRKDGSLSKGWLKWRENSARPPEQSKNWDNWNRRREEILSGNNPKYTFNLRSGDHLRWLMFDRLGNDPVDFTESGLPSIDSQSLRRFGPVGELLVRLSEINKELGYAEDYLKRCTMANRNTMHPGFRVPGTFTGRLSGSSPNLQQMPKTKRMMSCFTARPGYVLVDLDFAALETVVAAELSGDPALQNLYKDPDKPNDIYLYTAAHIRQFSAEIRATGYDPLAPTPETIAAAKKQCKHIRSLCKTVVLASQYLAGPRKIHATLVNDGVDVELEQVEGMHAGFWELYSGLKQYGWDLKDEWKANRGWVMNGIGRPLSVDDRRNKDLVNTVVQSTGHDLLVKYVSIVRRLLNEAEIEWYPYIADWHDAMTVEVPAGMEKEVARLMSRSVTLLNAEVGGDLPLTGKPVWGFTLADVKEPEQ